jgi:hypothetical protein
MTRDAITGEYYMGIKDYVVYILAAFGVGVAMYFIIGAAISLIGGA